MGFIEYFKLITKSTPTILTGIAIACIGYIFLPRPILKIIGIVEPKRSHSEFVGMLLLLSLGILVSYLLRSFFLWSKQKWSGYMFIYRSKRRLKDLTKEEKKLLRDYIFKDTRTQYLRDEDGVVKGLEYEKIIYPATNVGSILEGFAYNIQQWAWEYLKRHPELLK